MPRFPLVFFLDFRQNFVDCKTRENNSIRNNGDWDKVVGSVDDADDADTAADIMMHDRC